MKIGIIVEGADGLNWPAWKNLARVVEACGYTGLYRSDHYTLDEPPDKDSLELWVSLTWLASHTRGLEFGPLVTPFSFRDPTMTARMASAVDDLSGGRLVLGLGAGGWVREHQMFGLPLLGLADRMKRFEEGTQVIALLFESDRPVSFDGEFYSLKDAILLPRPGRPGGPPILIGGNGRKRTLPLAARFADEWNSLYLTPKKFIELNDLFNKLLEAEGRRPPEVTRSMLTGCVFGNRDEEVKAKYRAHVPQGLPPELEAAVISGTGSQIVDRISELAEAGLEKLILVWYDLTDLNGLEGMAKAILPHSQSHLSAAERGVDR
jgi:F420-dependent oxidoreductase-like protein